MLHGLDGVRARRTRTVPVTADSRTSAPLWLTGLLVAAALAGAGAFWLAGHRDVTFVVDGQVDTVQTHAATVGEALERAGIAVGPNDHVDPALDTALVHAMRVEVVHARQVTLLIGDAERRVVVTALTVDEVLAQLGSGTLEAPAGRRSLVRPSRMSRVSSGMVVELSAPVAMAVVVDGQRHEVITDESTVADVLSGLDLAFGPHDRIHPDVTHPAEDGLVVTVSRVEISEEAREVAIAFPTQERRTDALPEGTRREAQAGVEGVRRIIERVTLVDDVEESRERIGDEVVTEPQPRIVEVGTARPPEEPAQAEPAAPEPPNEPAQSAAGNVQEGKASWYDNPYGGYTAAHRTLPRGTIVTVKNVANGRSVQVRINDRGPFVDGRVIDLNRAAFAELASPSAGVIRVRLEW